MKTSELTLEQASPAAKSIVGKLGCPYQIFSSKSSYEEVMEAYWQAVEQGQKEGFTPLLVPADDILAECLDFDEYNPEEILKAVPESGEKLLEELYKEYTEDEEFELDEEFDGEADVIDSFSAFMDYHSDGIVETILLKIPTTKPWELTAYLPFGGWNDCPCAEDMTAICKYWFEKYGAIPVTISHDVLEMRLPAPVPKEEAMEIAREHFAFTTDRVYQCTASYTLGELADCIAASKIWYFWWD